MIFLRDKRAEISIYELTPPLKGVPGTENTAQLFTFLSSVAWKRNPFTRCIYGSHALSLEIVGNKHTGIRYLLHVPETIEQGVLTAIASHTPSVRAKKVAHSSFSSMPGDIREYKQAGHFAYPLKRYDSIDQNDPMAYITAAMTKLDQDEEMSLQLVIAPVRLKEARQLNAKILKNDVIATQLKRQNIPVILTVLKAMNAMMYGILDIITSIQHGGAVQQSANQYRLMEQQRVFDHKKPARSLSMLEQNLLTSIHEKLSEPHFQVSIRTRIVSADSNKTKERQAQIGSALASYSTAKYQFIQPKRILSDVQRRNIAARYQRRYSGKRIGSNMILSSSELAFLYHFPNYKTNQTENVVKSLSKQLPAPVSLKNGQQLGILIGENHYHEQTTPIGLTQAERERHVYIIGGTGNGKTTMLQYGIVQDMLNGNGLAVVDPHGDIAETLLCYVPPERIKDVVYFNPDDLEHPIGLNLLELTPGLKGNELLKEKDLITESVISVFRKIFSDEDAGGHRIEYVLRNTVQTALTMPDATLFTVFDLLNDPKYRKSVIKTLDDKNLINFWKHELGKAGDMQKVKMSAGITAKIGRFLFSASAKQILEQPKSTINFDDIINSGKILICNFSKGLLGEDTSELFGITVLAKLQLASLRRARLRQQERRAFYLYVDEFQNFATASFVQMLSESRKYKLFMTMAEQSTSQQDDQQMVSIILANVGTVICFRTGNPQDEKLLLPLFKPFVNEGEISNLSAFNFYARLSAINAQEPMSGQTMLLQGQGSDEVATAIIENSRANFAKRQSTSEIVQATSTLLPKEIKPKQSTIIKSTALLDIE